jgi:hypothetical protein
MSKKKNFNGKKQQKLRCPVCQESIYSSVDRLPFGGPMDFSLLPQPGELTQCDHCLTMLEYRGELHSPTLHVAPRKRVLEFNRLTREGHSEPSVPELLGYVMRHRQMPPSSSIRKQLPPR